MTKPLVPYAGAERTPVRKPSSAPASSITADVNEQLTRLLLDEIVRCRRDIRELEEEQDALNRMLTKIRADRGAIV